MTTEPFFLGRQPILDSHFNLVGYELLFRSGDGNNARFPDQLRATATVINHAFIEIGADAILGKYHGYININEALLMGDFIEFIANKKIVLEIPESIKVNDALIERCKMLKNSGFKFALENVTQSPLTLGPIMNLIDIIKIDLSLIEPGKLSVLVEQFKSWPVTLLAEKVESQKQFDQCVTLGFELFQGYFFARPHIFTGKRMSYSESALIKLLGLVLDDAETTVLELEFKKSPLLCYTLIKISNSAANGMCKQVTSIRSAIGLLGRQQLRRWIQILLFSITEDSTLSNPLLRLAVTRGNTMEQMAAKGNNPEFADKAWIVGILSLMDELLAIPILEVLATLPVGTDVKIALLKGEGELGKLLNLVENIEQKNTTGIELSDCP